MSRQSDRPKTDTRKLSTSEEQVDLYAGPLDFIEPGSRGFLVTTLPKKEEFAVDDAIDLLRQVAIKLYGGYKPSVRNFKGLERRGYVKIDCLDVENLKVWPHPGGEEEEAQEKKEAEAAADTEMSEDKGGKEEDGQEENMKEENMEEDNTDKADDVKKEVEENAEEKEEEAGAEVKEENEEEKSEKKEDEEGKEKSEEEKEKDKEEEEKEKKKEEEKEKKREEEKEKKKEEEKDSRIPRMHSIYKFNSFRTEMRNTMFIKSDVPDPMLMAEAAMELVMQRKSVTGDAVLQLLPVIGVCLYDYQQVEIMTRRTLSQVFKDESAEPQSFGLMLIDKLSEPGSEVVFEIVRNTLWSVNPLAWQCSPISEPDFVLRFELIGSCLVLSCLRNYMRYRQYAPCHLVDLGEGQAEDDDGGSMSEEAKRLMEEKRKEKEKQREQEKVKEQERQKERAKKLKEAETKRKEREEERKKRQAERREKEEKEKSEKESSKGASKEKGKSSKGKDKKSSPGKEDGCEDNEEDKEGTPPSKKQKTDTEDEGEEGGELEASVTEETPPPKKQRVDSAEISKEEEEMLLGDEEQEKVAEEEEEEKQKTPTKKKTTRGKRAGRNKKY